MFSIWFNARMDMSNHGLSHSFKDPGAVANGFTNFPQIYKIDLGVYTAENDFVFFTKLYSCLYLYF